MMIFRGIERGRRFEGSTGATHANVVLDATAITADTQGLRMSASGSTCVLTPGPASENTVFVLAHRSDAGTFHGIGREIPAVPCAVRGNAWRCVECNHVDVIASQQGCGEGYVHPAHDRPQNPRGERLTADEIRWEALSSSGGGEIWAAVLVRRPGARPVNRLTSGYRGRRGWTVSTFYADGRVESMPLSEWRAARVEGESL